MRVRCQVSGVRLPVASGKWQVADRHLLSTIYCLPSTVYRLPSTAYYLLPTAYSLLPASRP